MFYNRALESQSAATASQSAPNENIKIERNKFVIFPFLYLHSSRFNYLLSLPRHAAIDFITT